MNATVVAVLVVLLALVAIDVAAVAKARRDRWRAEVERAEALAELRAVVRVLPASYFPGDPLPDRVAQLVRDAKAVQSRSLWEDR